MRHQLTVRGPLDAEEVRDWLARPLARLRRQLVRFPPDAVHVRTLVRGAEGRPRAEAAVTLQLPSTTLAASEEGVNPRAAVNAAFQELERLVKKEKARLRRADGWRRSSEAFQRELLDRVAHQSERTFSEAESDRLGGHVQQVESFVRRELRWLELSGDIVSGEIDARDVVNTAFARAFAQREQEPSRQQLLQSASAALRSELSRARAARLEIHLEADGPEVVPEDAASTLGSEMFDFHQPDHELRVVDLVGGLVQTPEEIEATAELAEGLRDALAALPAIWRQAFHLSRVERLDARAIADALDVEVDEVPGLLGHARAFLRDRLVEAGLLVPGAPPR